MLTIFYLNGRREAGKTKVKWEKIGKNKYLEEKKTTRFLIASGGAS